MPRVLIPSDNRDFVVYLAEAYRQAGWEVVVGAVNFDLGAAVFDLVHLQWPEEFSGWNVPTDSRLAEISSRLTDWAQRTRLVLTAHNLRPHRDGDAANYRKLYDAFYEHVHVVAHFTRNSLDAVTSEFPSSANAKHVVTGYYNLDVLMPAERDPGRARRDLGIPEDAFVVLIFGGIREWSEVELIKQGFDAASIAGKRLLMCGRYDESGPAWRQRWRRWALSRWLRSRDAVVVPGFIPDAEVYRVADATDAVVIPRFRSMNSGLPALGVSFGKIIIAPRCGSYPELLEGTSHPIYQPGDATSLSRALESASRLDRALIESECRRLVGSWNWSNLINSVTKAAGR
jgi:hypothetical protein